MNSPIYDRLCAYKDKNRISFAMPSHKGGKGLKDDFMSLDVTELNDSVDLMHGDKSTSESLAILAKRYHADKSYILTCGSTIAVHAMICATLKAGDTLLAASDCHMSVINICSIMGINIRFIPKEYDISPAHPTKTKPVRENLKKYPDIKGCIVTSPNYFGVCSDIETIAKDCHDFNIPLLVDEAHGAHFITSNKFPKTAMELGADISCQSAHKTLAALTGGAYLHIKSTLVSPHTLHKALCIFHSSSPSYPIAASAEKAFLTLDDDKWNTWGDLCDNLKKDIAKNTQIYFLENDDPTRIVAIIDAYETTGYDIANALSQEHNIDVEMSTETAIVMITSPYNTKEELVLLTGALIKITSSLPERKERIKLFIPPCEDVLLSPRFAINSKSALLKDSNGCICADTITVYPPGIPVLFSGSKITQETINYLINAQKHNARITGITDNKINIIED